MGRIVTNIDCRNDLTICTVTGEITTEEIVAEIESYYLGTTTRLVLWDLSAASLGKISSADVGRIAEFTYAYTLKRAGGKTAIVVTSELGFGLARMYEIRHSVKGSPVTHLVCRSQGEALEWLGIAA